VTIYDTNPSSCFVMPSFDLSLTYYILESFNELVTVSAKKMRKSCRS